MLIAIVRGPEGERISQLDDEPIEIGRHGTLRLTDRRVSKHHARLQRDGSDWFVEDMGSTNGTFINGTRVDRPLRVKEGDKLELGSTEMVISKIVEPAAEENVPEPHPTSDHLPVHVEAPAPANEDPLAAWLHALPVKRDVIQSLTPAVDPSLLSIRPLAQRNSSAPPWWRRGLPYAALALVLLAVGANLLLLVLFRGEARRDARALRDALARQDQSSAEAVLRELREELRSPSAQQLQAWQAVGDSLAEKQAALTETLRAELAADRQAGVQLAAARTNDESTRTADESRAALMRELTEIKQAIAALNRAAPAQASPQPAAETATLNASPEASGVEDASVSTVTPPAAASPAPIAAAADQKSVVQTFLIDASAALEHAIPEAVAEVRRTIAATRQRGSSRILLLYQGRLIELPAAALESRDVQPLDLGASDLAAALKAALADRPPVLYVLSDVLGDTDANLHVIRQADTSATSIHVTQFYSREHREQLKALAREYHGNYSFIAPAR